MSSSSRADFLDAPGLASRFHLCQCSLKHQNSIGQGAAPAKFNETPGAASRTA
jgi:hypothetical protein